MSDDYGYLDEDGPLPVPHIKPCKECAALRAREAELVEALDMQVRNCPRCKGTGKAVHAVEFITGSNEKRDCEWCAKGRAALARVRTEKGETT